MNDNSLDLTLSPEHGNNQSAPKIIPIESQQDLSTLSPESLVKHLAQLLTDDKQVKKEEVDQIKLLFYKKIKAETEEQKQVFLEGGGQEIDFLPEKNIFEDEFKSLLNEFKSKRAAVKAKLEADKEQNLLEKQHVIERMRVLIDKKDDVSSHIPEFRDLQKKWKEIGHVPHAANNDIWKEYNKLQEEFWDLVKISFELRDYDFKKNLETKIALCVEAERLSAEENVLDAFNQLQKLHDEWREIGPVARDQREELWKRFREASSVINRKHQGHFEDVRKIEEENQQQKIALCEQIESVDYSSFNSYKAWNDATTQIISLQEEWRSIGFAPRKVNKELFQRYRAACDNFFQAKADFNKSIKSQLNENLDKKRALCDQAEQLKNSTDWKETTEVFINLQKEWKTIGHVPRKYSNELWKRFIAACDYFFEQKSKNTDGKKTFELENLTKKKELIAQINALDEISEKQAPEILLKLREFIAQWNDIGHVPYRKKDEVYKEYRSAIDKIFEKLNIDASQRRLDTFKSNLKDMTAKGGNKILRERDKLMRVYDHLKSEIATYENNIGFLTSTDKKGSGLIKEMDRKIQALKEEASLVEQKINMIDESM